MAKSKSMSKSRSKTIVISGPMDVKHVGGVNVMVNGSSMLDNYFPKKELQTDESLSTTTVPAGKLDGFRRGDTIADVIRRPTLSFKSSFSKLRTRSISQMSDIHRKSEGVQAQPADASIARPHSTKPAATTPLRTQSSLSRLRQRVGLDKGLHQSAPVSKAPTPEPDPVPEPTQQTDPETIQQYNFPSRAEKSVSHITASSIYSTPDPDILETVITIHPRPSTNQRQVSTTRRRPASHPTQSANTQTQQPALTTSQPPVRPKRADSGTAIDVHDTPAQERPLPFQKIMAESNFHERMAMYKKTREYWAHVDHGLVEWTSRAAGTTMFPAHA
jgi:hypothetical protein